MENYSDEKKWSPSELKALKSACEDEIAKQSEYLCELNRKRYNLAMELQKREAHNNKWYTPYLGLKGCCGKNQVYGAFGWYYVKDVRIEKPTNSKVDDENLIVVIVSVINDREKKVYKCADTYEHVYRCKEQLLSSDIYRTLTENPITQEVYCNVINNFVSNFGIDDDGK